MPQLLGAPRLNRVQQDARSVHSISPVVRGCRTPHRRSIQRLSRLVVANDGKALVWERGDGLDTHHQQPTRSTPLSTPPIADKLHKRMRAMLLMLPPAPPPVPVVPPPAAVPRHRRPLRRWPPLRRAPQTRAATPHTALQAAIGRGISTQRIRIRLSRQEGRGACLGATVASVASTPRSRT